MCVLDMHHHPPPPQALQAVLDALDADPWSVQGSRVPVPLAAAQQQQWVTPASRWSQPGAARTTTMYY
jgi:hypothetical protein